MARISQRTITYELNSGSWGEGVTPTAAFYTYQSEDVALAQPTREDYTFGGWYADEDLSGVAQTTVELPAVTDSKTYYAKWLSDNNALVSVTLTVGGQDYPLAAENGVYSIKFLAGTDLSEAEVTAVKEDENATVSIVRSRDGEERELNSWTITVTSESGIDATYTVSADPSLHAPALAEDRAATEAATVRPASLDGTQQAMAYSADVSTWFADEDGDELTCAIEELKVDGESAELASVAELAFEDGIVTCTNDAGATKTITFDVTVSDGEFRSPAVSVTLTLTGRPYSAPTLTVSAGEFDLYDDAESGHAALTVGFNRYESELASISVGGVELRADVDYSVDDSAGTVTFAPEWLDTLEKGDTTVLFSFTRESETITVNYTVTVTDTTPEQGGETGGGENTGGENTGGENTGGENTGGENTGGENTGGENTGGENTDGENTGGENTGGGSTGGNTGGNTGGSSNSGGNTGGSSNSGGNTGGSNPPSYPSGGMAAITTSSSSFKAGSKEEFVAESDGSVRLTLKKDEKLTDKQVLAAIENNAKARVIISTAEGLSVIIPEGTLEKGSDLSAMMPIISRAKAGDVVVYVEEDGSRTPVVLSIVEDGKVEFVADRVGKYSLDRVKISYPDTDDHWACDAVKFVSARGLCNGMGGGNFVPGYTTNRAMVFMILARLEGADTTVPEGGMWYDGALEWAKSKGISDGTRPTESITRESFVTMLWRMVGAPNYGRLAGFTDTAKVSDWANRAVAWAASEGILRGRPDGSIDPQAYTTRAEMATLIQRFVVYMIENA